MANVTAAIVKAKTADEAEWNARGWAVDRKHFEKPIEVVYIDVKGEARMIGTVEKFFYVDIHWVSGAEVPLD